jgi:hypothetical protein
MIDGGKYQMSKANTIRSQRVLPKLASMLGELITDDFVITQVIDDELGITVRFDAIGLGAGGFRLKWREADTSNDDAFRRVVQQRLASALMLVAKSKYLNY